MTATITPEVLSDIAAVPGFGKARQLLQQMGHWDEYAGDREPREFIVRFTGYVSAVVHGDVTVMARSAAEARELATVQADKGKLSWDMPDDPDNWDIVEVEDHGAAAA